MTTRYWGPAGVPPNTDDDGLLVPPVQSGYINQDLRTLEELSEIPCLVLLGEPGSGKTTELQRAAALSPDTLYVDCRSFHDAASVRDAFVSGAIAKFRANAPRATLLLDGLDEAVGLFPAVGTVLAQQLSTVDRDGLKIRISCRSAEWPPDVSEALKALWPEPAYAEYALAPLSPADVLAEAERVEVSESSEFLAAVRESGAAAFAARPLTLGLLLTMYKAGKALSSDPVTLHSQGIALLCSEHEARRRYRRKGMPFSAQECSAAASWIAAAMIFGGKSALWAALDVGDVPVTDLPQEQLDGASEPLGLGLPSFQISKQLVDETIRVSALFVRIAPERYQWAHATFAEFLAARWLHHHDLNAAQLLSLLVVRVGDVDRVPEPLRPVAAWLAGMKAEVFDLFLPRAPIVFLYSPQALTQAQKRRVVPALLSAPATTIDAVLDLRGVAWRQLSPENHEGEVIAVLSGGASSSELLQLAAILAGAMRSEAAVEPLARIAADPSQMARCRIVAARALAEIGNGEAILQLMQLVDLPAEEDSDDEIRGTALRALWPKWLEVTDLVDLITSRQNRNLSGSYSSFLWEIERTMTPSDAVTLLAGLTGKGGPADDMEDLLKSLMLRAIPIVSSPAEISAAAGALAALLDDRYRGLGSLSGETLNSALGARPDVRQALIVATLRHRKDDPHAASRLLEAHIADQADAMPLLKEAVRLESSEPEVAKQLAIYVSYSNYLSDPDLISLILEVAPSSAAVANAFQRHIGWMDIGSAEALHAIQLHEMHEEVSRRRRDLAAPKLLEPPPAERVANHLVKLQAGDLTVMTSLHWDLTLEPTSTHYKSPMYARIIATPGWAEADDATRAAIVAGARAYVKAIDPETAKWLGTDKYYNAGMTGYRCLRLLKDTHPELLEQLTEEEWKKWAPVLVWYRASAGDDDPEARRDLLEIALRKAREESLLAVETILRQEDTQYQSIPFLFDIEQAAAGELCPWVRKQSDGHKWSPRSRLELLRYLLRYSSDAFSSLLQAACEEIKGSNDPEAIAALAAFFRERPRMFAEHALPIIRQAPDLGRAIARDLASFLSSDMRLGQELDEKSTGALFEWLESAFPHAGDPDRRDGRAYSVGPEEICRDLRDSLLRSLYRRGTIDSVTEVERLRSVFPELAWMVGVVEEAAATAARETWQVTSPRVLLGLVRDSEARFVRNEQQLLDVVMESLQGLQRELTGEYPAAETLWDERDDGLWRPKDEHVVADLVARHLRSDLRAKGIIPHREVEITRRSRTDVHMSAVLERPDGSIDTIAIVIEVKGSWHRQLMKCMRPQLVDKYLAPEMPNKSGILLVGWFGAEGWDEDDGRWQDAQRHGDLEKVTRELTNQSKELPEGVDVRVCMLNCTRVAAPTLPGR